VGTKKQAQQAVKETAKDCNQYYVTERWLGHVDEFCHNQTLHRPAGNRKMEADGSINAYVKQEQAVIHREEAGCTNISTVSGLSSGCLGQCSSWTSSANTTPWPRPASSVPVVASWTRIAIQTWWITRSQATTTRYVPSTHSDSQPGGDSAPKRSDETKASRRKPTEESPLAETETAQIAAASAERARPVDTVQPE
jgi:hypothetical protein